MRPSRARWIMDWLNPVEWVAWIYGKLFQNHPTTGGFLVVMAFALLGFVLWVRGVDKYKEEHRDSSQKAVAVGDSVQPKDSPQTDDKSAPDSQVNGTKSNAKTSGIPAKREHLKTPSGGSGSRPTSPSGIIVQPGAAVSIGQQGGITVGQVIIASDDAIPAKIQWSQKSIEPPHPNLFPYAIQVTITPNKRVDSPNFCLFFDGPVDVPKVPITAMNMGSGRVNDANGTADPNTAWIFWAMPPLTPEKPLVFTVESLTQVHLVSISKGPKAPF